MATKVQVHNWVREARLQAGLTQEQLAELAGVTRRHIQFIDSTALVPSVGVALRLAAALNTRVDTLFALADPIGA